MSALSYTLNEWLALRKYSRAHWYRLPIDDRPEIIGRGHAQRITAEADARWERQQSQKAKQRGKSA
jgi:hypothetical protein